MRVTEENAAKIYNSYVEGRSTSWISMQFGMHPTYVRRAVERAAEILGVDPPEKRRAYKNILKLGCDMDDALFLVESCGLVLAAEYLGVSSSTLRRRLNHRGLRAARNKKKYKNSLYMGLLASGMSLSSFRSLHESD